MEKMNNELKNINKILEDELIGVIEKRIQSF